MTDLYLIKYKQLWYILSANAKTNCWGMSAAKQTAVEGFNVPEEVKAKSSNDSTTSMFLLTNYDQNTNKITEKDIRIVEYPHVVTDSFSGKVMVHIPGKGLCGLFSCISRTAKVKPVQSNNP